MGVKHWQLETGDDSCGRDRPSGRESAVPTYGVSGSTFQQSRILSAQDQCICTIPARPGHHPAAGPSACHCSRSASAFLCYAPRHQCRHRLGPSWGQTVSPAVRPPSCLRKNSISTRSSGPRRKRQERKNKRKEKERKMEERIHLRTPRIPPHPHHAPQYKTQNSCARTQRIHSADMCQICAQIRHRTHKRKEKKRVCCKHHPTIRRSAHMLHATPLIAPQSGWRDG